MSDQADQARERRPGTHGTIGRNDYYNDPLLQEVSSCQRNFDQTKSIDPETMSILDEWVGRSPQQCGELNYNVIKILNPDCILSLSKKCGDPESASPFDNVDSTVFQPQMNGFVCYVWTIPMGGWFKERNKEYNPSLNNFSIGFASGLVAMRATALGLKTGFTQCGPWDTSTWKEWLAEWKLDYNKHQQFSFALGLGYGNDKKHYSWSKDNGISYHHRPEWPEVDVI